MPREDPQPGVAAADDSRTVFRRARPRSPGLCAWGRNAEGARARSSVGHRHRPSDGSLGGDRVPRRRRTGASRPIVGPGISRPPRADTWRTSCTPSRMALREFEDAQGQPWHVWETAPSRAESLGSFRLGWLTFDNGTERRRLAPIPDGWAELTVERLDLLLRAAHAAPIHEPRVDPDAERRTADRRVGERRHDDRRARSG